jgi:hypothetical protein
MGNHRRKAPLIFTSNLAHVIVPCWKMIVDLITGGCSFRHLVNKTSFEACSETPAPVARQRCDWAAGHPPSITHQMINVGPGRTRSRQHLNIYIAAAGGGVSESGRR